MSEDFLVKFPDDPLNSQQMADAVVLCVQNDKNYKKISDKIVQVCLERAKTPLKVQKIVIDKVKEIIKAEPDKFRAQSKFFALKLLNKVILKKNNALNVYVEQKIMSRLTVLAEWNNDPDENSAQALLTRGKYIFGPEEKDTQSSANFLIILLDCIEKWALTFLEDADEMNDAISTSTKTRSGSTGDKFYRAYQKLIDKGVKFPSTFKSSGSQEKKSAPVSRSQQQVVQAAPAQSSSSQFATGTTMSSMAVSDTQSVTSHVITPEKKDQIIALKKKMQNVKELSKQTKMLVEKLRTDGDDFDVEQVEVDSLIEESLNMSNGAINELMSDEIQPHISNAQDLLKKMLGYNEVFNGAQAEMRHFFDKQKKKQRSSMKVLEEQKRQHSASKSKPTLQAPDDDEEEQLRRAIEESKREAKQQSIKNSLKKKEVVQEIQEEEKVMNPYEFENMADNHLFGTQIQQNMQFDLKAFNDTPRQAKLSAGKKKQKEAAPVQDFGFDFSVADKTAHQVPVASKDDYPEESNDPQDSMPDEPVEDDIVEDSAEGGINPLDARMQTMSMQSHRKTKSNQKLSKQVEAPSEVAPPTSPAVQRNSINSSVKKRGNEFQSPQKTPPKQRGSVGIRVQRQDSPSPEREEPFQFGGFAAQAPEANNDFNFDGMDKVEQPKQSAAPAQSFDNFGFGDASAAVAPASDGFSFDVSQVPAKPQPEVQLDHQQTFGFSQAPAEPVVEEPKSGGGFFDNWGFGGASAPEHEVPAPMVDKRGVDEDFNEAVDENEREYSSRKSRDSLTIKTKHVKLSAKKSPEKSEPFTSAVKVPAGIGMEPSRQEEKRDQKQRQMLQDLEVQLKAQSYPLWWQYDEDIVEEEQSSIFAKPPDIFKLRDIKESIEKAGSQDDRVFELQREIENLRESHSTEKNESVLRISQLELEIDSFNQQIAAVKEECEREMRRKNEDVQQRTGELEQRESDLQFQLQQVQSRLAEVEEREATAQEQEMKSSQRLQEAQVALQAETQKTMMQEQQLQEKQRRIDELEITVKADLERQVANLQKMLNDEIAKSSEQQEQNDVQLEFTRAKNAWEMERKQLEEKLAQMQTQNEQLQDQLSKKPTVIEVAAPSTGIMTQAPIEIKQEVKPVVEASVASSAASQDPFSFGVLNVNAPKSQAAPPEPVVVAQVAAPSPYTDSAMKPEPQVEQKVEEYKPMEVRHTSKQVSIDFNFGLPQPSQVAVTEVKQAGSAEGAKDKAATDPFQFDAALSQRAAPLRSISKEFEQSSVAFSMENLAKPVEEVKMAAPVTSQANRPETPPKQLPGQSPAKNQVIPNMMLQRQSLSQHQPSMSVSQSMAQLPSMRQMQPAHQFSESRNSVAQLSSSASTMNFGTNMSFAQQQPANPALLSEVRLKLQTFLLNSIAQGERSVIYEDNNVKIGLIRAISEVEAPGSARGPPGLNRRFVVRFKVFIRNKSATELIKNLSLPCLVKNPQTGAIKPSSLIKVVSSSMPLPLQQPLAQNQTVESELELLVGIAPQPLPGQMPMRHLKFAMFQLSLNYELAPSGVKNPPGPYGSGLSVYLPLHVLHFLSPASTLLSNDFQTTWKELTQLAQQAAQSGTPRTPGELSVKSVFTLDKSKVSNMAKLHEVVTGKGETFAHIRDVDQQSNIVSFAATLKKPKDQFASPSSALILVKMDLTREGTGCRIAIQSKRDHESLAPLVLESLLALISVQTQ